MGDTETEPLTSRRQTWDSLDRKLLLLGFLIKLGDGIEVYLPSVVTQKVSCELGVTSIQENFLAVILYVSLALTNLVAVPISRRIGERNVLLLSLYSSILSTGFCSLVPNYYILLSARALIGVSIGLNFSSVGVFISQYSSGQNMTNKTSFLIESIAYTIGTTWVALFAWMLLDTINWRIFLLVTSVPFFLPPIIMLHFNDWDALKRTVEGSVTETAERETTKDETDSSSSHDESMLRRDNKAEDELPRGHENTSFSRTGKLGLFQGLSCWVGYGGIMLLPALIQQYNREIKDTLNDQDPCGDIVHGYQYGILAVASGAANVVGRLAGFVIRNHVRFLALHTTVAVIIGLSYIVILIYPTLTIISILMSVNKFGYAIQGVEYSMLKYNLGYWASVEEMTVGSAVTSAAGQFGALIGISLASFLQPQVATGVYAAVTLFVIGVIFSMTELH